MKAFTKGDTDMKVNQWIRIMVVCASALSISGCSSLTGGSSSTGKWLDFGNGVLNLDQTSRIIPTANVVQVFIKFDEFQLNLAAPNTEGKSFDEKQAANQAVVDANMKQVRDFLNSNKSYMRLE